ncbi:MAG: hypothetical protein DHS20C18_13080 [Saprospiraceae bacterium]|nr:MAG: hypothetical protein DHS20C18_13080 [Saprospiraceae bacterium]
MDRDDIKRILYITIGLTVVSIFILTYFGKNVFTWPGIKLLSTIFSGIVIFWMFYFKYGWKYPILKLIVYKENFNGTWFGEYYSKDFDTDREYRGQISLVIRQSFININVTSYTEKYLAYSYAETLLCDKERKKDQLVYLYSQDEMNPTKESTRKGTTELIFVSELEFKKLFGPFWTNTNSKGKLTVKKISNKHLTSFGHAKKKYESI